MRKRIQLFIACLTLAIAILACDLSIPSFPIPTTGGTPTPPFSPEQLGTAVAMTLTAAVPGGAEATRIPFIISAPTAQDLSRSSGSSGMGSPSASSPRNRSV
jgi:hypothetical protein